MPLLRAARPRTVGAFALDSADPAQRRLAVADCQEADALFARLEQETDGGVRHAILTRLGTLEQAGVAARLVPLLASEDVALRNDAILALRRRGVAALPALQQALRSADPDLRIFAANVLGGIPVEGARALLRTLLVEERDANVCLAAVEALAQMGTAAELPVLRALRARFADEPCLVFAVAVALDAIGEGA